MLIALDDAKELELIPKYQIRFHIAHCYDGAEDFKRAVEEYRKLLADHERSVFQLPVTLLAIVYRQLGNCFSVKVKILNKFSRLGELTSTRKRIQRRSS